MMEVTEAELDAGAALAAMQQAADGTDALLQQCVDDVQLSERLPCPETVEIDDDAIAQAPRELPEMLTVFVSGEFNDGSTEMLAGNDTNGGVDQRPKRAFKKLSIQTVRSHLSELSGHLPSGRPTCCQLC